MRQHRAAPLRRRATAAVGLMSTVTAMVMGAAGAGVATAAEPDPVIVQADNHVAGSYVVSFDDDADASSSPSATKRAARSLADKYDGELKSTFTASMRGFAVRELSEKDARKLAAEPAVRKVFEDGTASIAGAQQDVTWGIDRVDQRDLPLDNSYTYGNTASDVTAYVLDTGIRYSHNEFEGRAKSGYDFVDEDPDANDCHGHGTHVAGTIGGKTYGVAKKVGLVGVKVLGCGGSAPDSDSIEGIEWVTKNASGPSVANMSLIFDTPDIGDEAMAGMIDAGVTTVVAAGNSSADACNTGPAKIPEVITAGSTDSSDNRSSFSNYGTCLDLFAPGSNITSASHSSDSGSTTMSGTSMASPHGAGAAAMYLQTDKSASPAKVSDSLTSNATSGVVGNPGSGSPNKLLYTGYLGGDDPDDPPPPDDGEFTLSVSPESVQVEPGDYISVTVSTTAGDAGKEDVDLTAAGLPEGAKAVFQPETITSGNTSKLTIDTSDSTPSGTSDLTVTGASEATKKKASLKVTVGDGGGDPDPEPGEIAVSASPSSGTVQQGFFAETRVTAAGGEGPLKLSASGAPSGSQIYFNPQTISNGGSSVIYITTSWSTPPGTYDVVFTATDGSGAKGSTTYTLTVTPWGSSTN